MKTVTVNDRTYQLAPMKFGEGRQIFQPGADAFDANCAMVAAGLNNADGGTRTADDVKAMPYPDGAALVLACLEINGLKKTGEAPAAPDRPSAPKAGAPGAPNAA
jgi:hypothetical protein